MPVYATLADLTARVDAAELTQVTNGIDGPDPTRVADALTAAASIVDGYVAASYRLPLDPVPPLLVEIACDIARRRLWRSTPTEDVLKRHDEAIARLKDIASGKLKLDQGVEQLPARPDFIVSDGPAPVFGRNSMAGY